MAVFPKYETYNFCYWLQNLSWQRLTTPQDNLVTIIATASINQTSVTDQQWKDFNMVSSSRYANYQQWLTFSTVQSGYLQDWLSVLPSQPPQFFISAVSRFIDTLVNSGVWLELDRLWLFASPSSAISLYSIVNPSSSACSLVANPTFTPYLGFTGNGSSSRINTNFTPSADGVKYVLNSASFGTFSRIAESAINFSTLMGCSSGSNYNILWPRGVGDVFYAYINDTTTPFNVTNTNTKGLITAVRSSSSSISAYTNGVLLGSASVASSSLVTNPFNILSLSGGSFSANQISFAFIGSGAFDQMALYGAVYQLSRELGFNI